MIRLFIDTFFVIGIPLEIRLCGIFPVGAMKGKVVGSLFRGNMSKNPFTISTIECIRSIPKGKVATYGGIARMAGNPRAARQVSRVLHTFSRKEGLPWHRVINWEGRISLASFQGGDDQRQLLEGEGVVFDDHGRVDLKLFQWLPDKVME